MNYTGQFQYYLINPANGNYFTATQDADGVYAVGDTAAVTPVKNDPKGWDDFKISWQRDTTYYGVMRSVTNSFGFVNDGRGILQQLFYAGYGGAVYGSEAQCILRVGVWNEATFNYDTLYQGYINFTTVEDDVQAQIFNVACIDSILKQNLLAYGNTSYNIPYWKPDGSGGWLINDAAIFYHKSIKLLYDQQYTVGAVPANPLVVSLSNSLGAVPFVFSLEQINYVQVNGSQTYVGNDILQQNLVVGQQQFLGEISLSGFINCYQQNSYAMKNLLSDGSDIAISTSVEFVINSIAIKNPSPGTYQVFVFKMFNVTAAGSFDSQYDFAALVIGNQAAFSVGATVTLGTVGAPLIYAPNGTPVVPPTDNLSSFNAYVTYTTDLSIGFTLTTPLYKNGMASVLSMSNFTNVATLIPTVITFGDLQFSIYSTPTNYNTPAPLSNVSAPKLPGSPAMGFRPMDLFKKLTIDLFTIQTDPYGFPDVSTLIYYSGETAVSDFLENHSVHDTLSPGTLDPANNWDNVPYDTLWVSGNSYRDITGINYMTTSMSTFFKTCRNLWCVGLGIETVGGVEQLRIEPLSYFFDETILLLDLGSAFFGLKITPLTSMQGNNLKTGYQQRQPNADYGIDSFCVEQDYRIPVTKEISDVDLTVPDNADMYQQEFARAEQNNKDQSGANSDNATYIVELDPNHANDFVTEVVAPDGTIVGNIAATVLTYPTVQNTDPLAASAPYILGLNYPDTATNMGLSPVRNVLRNGALIASWLGGLASRSLAFTKQYQLLFNNWIAGGGGFTEALYPAMRSNLQVGSGTAGLVVEAQDIPIAGMSSSWGSPALTTNQLFQPVLIEFSTSAPVNIYAIMGSDPRGYISITDTNRYTGAQKVYKGFIWDIEQKVGNESVTRFTLMACPGQTFI